MKIDIDNIKRMVGKALETQFEIYSWENMIDDCDLSKEEKQWAKENLTYKVEEVSALYGDTKESKMNTLLKQSLILCLLVSDKHIEIPNYIINDVDFSQWDIQQVYRKEKDNTEFTLIKI